MSITTINEIGFLYFREHKSFLFKNGKKFFLTQKSNLVGSDVKLELHFYGIKLLLDFYIVINKLRKKEGKVANKGKKECDRNME